VKVVSSTYVLNTYANLLFYQLRRGKYAPSNRFNASHVECTLLQYVLQKESIYIDVLNIHFSVTQPFNVVISNKQILVNQPEKSAASSSIYNKLIL